MLTSSARPASVTTHSAIAAATQSEALAPARVRSLSTGPVLLVIVTFPSPVLENASRLPSPCHLSDQLGFDRLPHGVIKRTHATWPMPPLVPGYAYRAFSSLARYENERSRRLRPTIGQFPNRSFRRPPTAGIRLRVG